MTTTTVDGGQDAILLRALTERAEAAKDALPGHGQRTALVARLLAQQLMPGITPAMLEQLDVASRAHELGAVLAPGATPAEQAAIAVTYLDANSGPAALRLLTRSAPDAQRDIGLALLRHSLQLAELIDRSVTAGLRGGVRITLAVGETLDVLRPHLGGLDADALAESLLLMYTLSGLATPRFSHAA